MIHKDFKSKICSVFFDLQQRVWNFSVGWFKRYFDKKGKVTFFAINFHDNTWNMIPNKFNATVGPNVCIAIILLHYIIG